MPYYNYLIYTVNQAAQPIGLTDFFKNVLRVPSPPGPMPLANMQSTSSVRQVTFLDHAVVNLGVATPSQGFVTASKLNAGSRQLALVVGTMPTAACWAAT